MRITRDLLERIAETTIEERVKDDPTIVAAYLHGSVLEGFEPVLGGTADIDLVFVHDKFDGEREIIRMTEDVTLDIVHHSKSIYQPPKDLRQRPWLGNTVFICKPVYDPDHFITFTQASVRGLFHNYENVLARSQELLNRGRATWLNFHNRPYEFGPEQVTAYLQAIEDAANAVSNLVGQLLAERRFLVNFGARVQELKQPDLYYDWVALLAGENFIDKVESVDAKEEVKSWMLDWQANFKQINEGYETPPGLHTHRLAYYMRAFETMLLSEQPESLLWPLIHSWTKMARTMPSQMGEWRTVCEDLGLMGPQFEDRLDQLDAYLDAVEILLEKWEP
ncbi:MAG TPA: hypothetical protein VJ965_02870 [Anaerolineales bacterium]|nr:hypothetical protein [Anaerolineales bacterium]